MSSLTEERRDRRDRSLESLGLQATCAGRWGGPDRSLFLFKDLVLGIQDGHQRAPEARRRHGLPF